MPTTFEIRADYDKESIVVYQAYSKAIAEAALKNGTFTAPFSFQRMTWIKPSFLWLMERSNWGRKSGQEHILAVRLKRSGWDEAVSLAVLSHPENSVHGDADKWRQQFDEAVVHVQWDPERSLRGESLEYKSIQIGISRHLIERYVNEWVIDISDYTSRAHKMYQLIQAGQSAKAKLLLPKERVYPVAPDVAKTLGMNL